MRQYVRGAPIPYLREWRHHRLMSRKQLALLAGITERAIAYLEAGRPANFGTIARLASALRVTPATLARTAPRTSTAA